MHAPKQVIQPLPVLPLPWCSAVKSADMMRAISMHFPDNIIAQLLTDSDQVSREARGMRMLYSLKTSLFPNLRMAKPW